MKVHYVGYSDEYDEWKEAGEIVHNVDLLKQMVEVCIKWKCSTLSIYTGKYIVVQVKAQ